MDAWWAKGAPGAPLPVSRPRAVAYYRHSAQDRQENSIPLQREQVRKWAQEQGIEIIMEFADHGKSGLSAEHRDAFNDMLENWVKKRSDFQYILVLDVSRWGRFQDVDLSATYSAECTRAGKKVVYTTLGLPKKDDPFHSMVIGFERYRAAQYSRELSDKVFKGCAKVAEQGFRPGGTPPYALYRLLLNEARLPVQILKPSERKSIQNQRVTLAPGDPKHQAVVRRIFEECAHLRYGAQQIAEGLNRDGIPSPGGAEWDADNIREILTNEHYIGTVVYNKSTSRLLSRPRANPRKEWIQAPLAFQGIIPKELYQKAQAVLLERRLRCTPEVLLKQLRSIYEARGTVTPALVQSNPETPSVNTYLKRYRSLGAAFQKLFPEVHDRVAKTVRAELSRLVDPVEEFADFMVLGQKLTVLIQPSVPVPRGYHCYWPFLPDPREVIDITLGVPLSGAREGRILGYLAFPRLLVRTHPIRISYRDNWRIELFGHHGLDFIKELLS